MKLTVDIKHETVISHAIEPLWKTFQNSNIPVMHLANLAMLDIGCVYNSSAEGCSNALVSKANAKYWDVGLPDESRVEAKVSLSFRSTWSRR